MLYYLSKTFVKLKQTEGYNAIAINLMEGEQHIDAKTEENIQKQQNFNKSFYFFNTFRQSVSQSLEKRRVFALADAHCVLAWVANKS